MNKALGHMTLPVKPTYHDTNTTELSIEKERQKKNYIRKLSIAADESVEPFFLKQTNLTNSLLPEEGEQVASNFS